MKYVLKYSNESPCGSFLSTPGVCSFACGCTSSSKHVGKCCCKILTIKHYIKYKNIKSNVEQYVAICVVLLQMQNLGYRFLFECQQPNLFGFG